MVRTHEPQSAGRAVCQNPAVADLDELKIPKGMRPVAEDIIQITDQVCAKLLDAEYADLAIPYIPALGPQGTAAVMDEGADPR